ncbi:MAG: dual specificity protein phosphatase family protein [Methanomicrobiales archaeon]|nr:dual specificity protein phosphatase family protein [Methanomicrobiales archaeon]
MEEVYRNLFIGDLDDNELIRGRPDWAVIHAEKEMHLKYVEKHRLIFQDAILSPDRTELFLAFEDAMKVDQVNTRCIPPALDFAHRHLSDGRKVLIHCIAGVSRSPTIALLYLLKYTDVLPRTNIFDAIFSFSEIYPLYNPNDGLFAYAAKFLEEVKETVETR